ncbi:MAG: hypothetical protein ACTTIC_05980 [Helicobacteraceae bacterium]
MTDLVQSILILALVVQVLRLSLEMKHFGVGLRPCKCYSHFLQAQASC